MKRLIVCFCLVSFSCVYSLKAQNPSVKTSSLFLDTKGEQLHDVRYKTTPEEDLLLDIYYPPAKAKDERVPVLVYVHGGGWFNGSKANITKGLFKPMFQELVEQGFAVVAVNYRLTRHKSVVMRDCVVDVMDAVRYLAKNSNTLGLDANRVFVLGDSAGGQLAQMLVLANPSRFQGDKELRSYSYKIVAGVSWYGPSDFTRMEMFETDDPSKNPDRFYDRIMRAGADSLQRIESYKEMSPVFYLSSQSPPLFMMAGDNDTTIPVAHALRMKEKADSIGAPVDLLVVKNAGHNWREAGGEINPSKDVIVQKTIEFFMKYK